MELGDPVGGTSEPAEDKATSVEPARGVWDLLQDAWRWLDVAVAASLRTQLTVVLGNIGVARMAVCEAGRAAAEALQEAEAAAIATCELLRSWQRLRQGQGPGAGRFGLAVLLRDLATVLRSCGVECQLAGEQSLRAPVMPEGDLCRALLLAGRWLISGLAARVLELSAAEVDLGGRQVLVLTASVLGRRGEEATLPEDRSPLEACQALVSAHGGAVEHGLEGPLPWLRIVVPVAAG